MVSEDKYNRGGLLRTLGRSPSVQSQRQLSILLGQSKQVLMLLKLITVYKWDLFCVQDVEVNFVDFLCCMNRYCSIQSAS